jgi:hypothetical protein
LLFPHDATGKQLMEIVNYKGWQNCVRLANETVEMIVTTDVGPRVIRFGFIGGPNLLKEFESDLGSLGGDKWKPYGGHRLWHAPEHSVRTYVPDNSPVEYTFSDGVLKLTQPVEAGTGMQKEIEITLSPWGEHARLRHRLINRNLWEVEMAVWCLTVMAPGGRAVLPQEPFAPWPDALLPARPVVLWHYTNMSDPRYRWGERFIQLRQDSSAPGPQKLGIRNSVGWGAYALEGQVFLKRTRLLPEANYPDFGCNWEVYTNTEMLELESLGPISRIPADGGSIEHLEEWNLFKADIGELESDLDRVFGKILGSLSEQ